MEDDVDEILGRIWRSRYPNRLPSGTRSCAPWCSVSSSRATCTRPHSREFARDVVAIVTTAASVPVAFAEGFLRSFLSIQSVEEDDSGHVIIRAQSPAPRRRTSSARSTRSPRRSNRRRVQPVGRAADGPTSPRRPAEVMRSGSRGAGRSLSEELQSALQDLEEREPPAAPARGVDIEPIDEVRRRMSQVRDAIRAYQSSPRSSSASIGCSSRRPRSSAPTAEDPVSQPED